SLRKRCARWRASIVSGFRDLPACLRACLRASAPSSSRAFTTVERLHLAILATLVNETPGLALSAAIARWRGASRPAAGKSATVADLAPCAAAWRFGFFLRGALRGFGPGRPALRSGVESELNTGARMAPRTFMVLSGSRWRATTLLMAASVEAGSNMADGLLQSSEVGTRTLCPHPARCEGDGAL